MRSTATAQSQEHASLQKSTTFNEKVTDVRGAGSKESKDRYFLHADFDCRQVVIITLMKPGGVSGSYLLPQGGAHDPHTACRIGEASNPGPAANNIAAIMNIQKLETQLDNVHLAPSGLRDNSIEFLTESII